MTEGEQGGTPTNPALAPMAGVRVVEAAQMIAGPLATGMLADQGAEVIKVEPPTGDRMRPLGDIRRGMGTVFHSTNRGKRSISLNTKDEAGLAAMLALVDTADVFLQNFRPGVADRLGFGYEAVAERNPSIIYVSVTGFGPTGPYADQMVYDYVVQGLSGWSAVEGGDGPPTLSNNLVIDKTTALTTSQAITAALFHRERTGQGQHIDISMLDAAVQYLWPDGGWGHTLVGDDGAKMMPPMSGLYNVWATADGYVSVNFASNSTFGRMCQALCPAWEADPRFADYATRMTNVDALIMEATEVLASMTTAEVLKALAAHDVPGGPALPVSEVHLDPQIIHRKCFVEHETDTIGKLREPRPAARFDQGLPEPPGAAPSLGQHTVDYLAELGYDEDAIDALVADGVAFTGRRKP